MSLIKQIGSLSKRTIFTNAPSIKEANIIGLGTTLGKYKLKLRNGTVINEVIGEVGLSIGQSVTVAKFSGKTNRYVVLSVGYQSTGTITEVEV
uniref:Uncharacterized protein n=1 Tax=viral metagenome TaxID=1070528 RepID=A0A6M3LBP4_9ZZZZ